MRKKEAPSFQSIIHNNFMIYSIVPVFITTCFTLLFILFIQRYSLGQSNKIDNNCYANSVTNMLESYSQELVDISSLTDGEKFKSSDGEEELFQRLYSINSTYRINANFYIIDENYKEAFTFGDSMPKYLYLEEYTNWGILKLVKEKPNEVCVAVWDGDLCIGMSTLTNNGRYYIVFTIQGKNIEDMLGPINNQLVITDSMGYVYYSNKSSYKDNLSRLDESIGESEGLIKYKGDRLNVQQTSIPRYGLKIFTIIRMNNNFKVVMIILATILAIFAAISIITFYSTKRISIKYTHDIDELANAFERVQNGDLEVKLDINSSREFQTIGKNFNVMTDGLKKQIERNKEMAEHVAFAQVKQLESQFNPHFIFNTLDNIRFMTKIDLNSADKMIVSLSKLLRYSIRDARETLTVREDLDNLQSYLNILQIRFNKRFSYEINIEEEIMNCLIPKLLIQPLIENSVKYGFVNQEFLYVKVSGYRIDEKVIFTCEDNGVGMEEELLDELRNQLNQERNTSGHSGLYNIHRRIHLLYKEDYGMKIESEPNKGTRIKLVMPYRV